MTNSPYVTLCLYCTYIYVTVNADCSGWLAKVTANFNPVYNDGYYSLCLYFCSSLFTRLNPSERVVVGGRAGHLLIRRLVVRSLDLHAKYPWAGY